jgi:hypothetical protein
MAKNPDAKIVWLEADGRETIVRRAGDSVLIVRGKSETAKVLEQLGG